MSGKPLEIVYGRLVINGNVAYWEPPVEFPNVAKYTKLLMDRFYRVDVVVDEKIGAAEMSRAIVNPHMGSYGYLKRGSIFRYVGCTGTNVSHQNIHLTCVEESEGKCTGMDNDGYKLEFDKHYYVSLSNNHCVKYSIDGD
jgi:hypothetical protein